MGQDEPITRGLYSSYSARLIVYINNEQIWGYINRRSTHLGFNNNGLPQDFLNTFRIVQARLRPKSDILSYLLHVLTFTEPGLCYAGLRDLSRYNIHTLSQVIDNKGYCQLSII